MVSVAKCMMTARDSSENHLFTSSEFLTSQLQQLSSFFSRLSSKHYVQDQVDDSNIKEDQHTASEKVFGVLRSEVLQEVAPSHPIYYDSFNICELTEKSKLNKFSIQMLRDICEHCYYNNRHNHIEESPVH